jgi:hypothetical protein
MGVASQKHVGLAVEQNKNRNSRQPAPGVFVVQVVRHGERTHAGDLRIENDEVGSLLLHRSPDGATSDETAYGGASRNRCGYFFVHPGCVASNENVRHVERLMQGSFTKSLYGRQIQMSLDRRQGSVGSRRDVHVLDQLRIGSRIAMQPPISRVAVHDLRMQCSTEPAEAGTGPCPAKRVRTTYFVLLVGVVWFCLVWLPGFWSMFMVVAPAGGITGRRNMGLTIL